MKTLGTTILITAALLVPVDLDAQPRKGRHAGVHVELSYNAGPRPYVRCNPRWGRAHVRCRAPRYYTAPRVHARRNRWVRAHLGEIHLYAPEARYGQVRLGRRGLEEVMGRGTVRELRRMARRAGFRGQITGRWTESRRYGTHIEVRMGGRLIAQVEDYNRDGYVDQLLVLRYLRY